MKSPRVPCPVCGKVVALEKNDKLYGHSVPYHMRGKIDSGLPYNRNWCPNTDPPGESCPCCNGTGRIDIDKGMLIP